MNLLRGERECVLFQQHVCAAVGAVARPNASVHCSFLCDDVAEHGALTCLSRAAPGQPQQCSADAMQCCGYVDGVLGALCEGFVPGTPFDSGAICSYDTDLCTPQPYELVKTACNPSGLSPHPGPHPPGRCWAVAHSIGPGARRRVDAGGGWQACKTSARLRGAATGT